MKINTKIFSIPPHISTSWDSVSAIHMKGDSLFVSLIDGESIEINNLRPDHIHLIFSVHAQYLEEESRVKAQQANPFGILPFSLGDEADPETIPLRFGINGIESFGSAVQHNPSQANLADLPNEILEKIISVAKIFAPEDPMAVPKPEPHCNCMYCQIARAINRGLGFSDMYEKEEHPKIELPETEEFIINQTSEKLYTVFDNKEPDKKYNVFLGEPMGCTCGKEGCEHLIAVLKS